MEEAVVADGTVSSPALGVVTDPSDAELEALIVARGAATLPEILQDVLHAEIQTLIQALRIKVALVRSHGASIGFDEKRVNLVLDTWRQERAYVHYGIAQTTAGRVPLGRDVFFKRQIRLAGKAKIPVHMPSYYNAWQGLEKTGLIGADGSIQPNLLVRYQDEEYQIIGISPHCGLLLGGKHGDVPLSRVEIIRDTPATATDPAA